ncbi:MAG: MCE family protein [Firmicutes bacterium]|nr:MCE family protein [Bacillota bacterium]
MLNTEAKVGFFVLIILTITILGLMWLKGKLLLDRHQLLEAEFTHVGGLRAGAPVQMSGVDIGRVDRVSLTPEGRVLVRLRLNPKIHLKADSSLQIVTAGMLGEKIIEVLPGKEATQLPKGAILRGSEPFSTETLLQETLVLLTSVQQAAGALNELFSDQKLQENLMITCENLVQISAHLVTFSSALNSAKLSSAINNLEQITAELATVEFSKVNTLVNSLSEVPTIFKQVNSVLSGLDSLQVELNTFMTELRAEGRTVETFQVILDELEPTVANLRLLSDQLVNGTPNLATLLSTGHKTLESVHSITDGVNNFLEEAAGPDSANTFKSAADRAGRVLNLADEFFEAYDRLSFSNQVAVSSTENDWGLDYRSKISWGTGDFLFFSCEDFGDRNRLSFQYGLVEHPWQLRLGIRHNWLGLGVDYQWPNFSLQTDLWHPNRPVLDLYARYNHTPFHFRLGLHNCASPNRQWSFSAGWTF